MTAEPRVLSGRYRVDELIGRGGMADRLPRLRPHARPQVAIKLLNRELANDHAFRTRFRHEAQAASRMAHPTIVRVFDAGEDTVIDALTARCVPVAVHRHGARPRRAAQRHHRRGPACRSTTPCAYVDGILDALEYSHRAGVVHRDIKPGNVMVTDAGQVKVMDFGIARAVSDSSSTVAETTAILGTAAYFSPEQAKGETGRRAHRPLLHGRRALRAARRPAAVPRRVARSPSPTSTSAKRRSTVRGQRDRCRARSTPSCCAPSRRIRFQRYQDAAAFREALDATVDGTVAVQAPGRRADRASCTARTRDRRPRPARSLRQLSTDTTMKRTQRVRRSRGSGRASASSPCC